MLYAATPDYAHSAAVERPQRLLFVSGTMGLDASGAAPATLEAQLALVWDNLRAILADAGALSVADNQQADTWQQPL